MKPIIEKVLASGLVDAATAQMMEHFKMIPEGSASLVNGTEKKLESATSESLKKLAEDLAYEVEKEHKIRETALDLERIRWPSIVRIHDNHGTCLATDVSAVRDRMGRYYFRLDDVRADWFVPGHVIRRFVSDHDVPGAVKSKDETILDASQLFVGDEPACWQVTAE